jgi:hypothetical protein
MAMTSNKKGATVSSAGKKTTTYITSDMVLDLYAKAKKAKGNDKKILMERVVFLSENLNHYTPIILSDFQ